MRFQARLPILGKGFYVVMRKIHMKVDEVLIHGERNVFHRHKTRTKVLTGVIIKIEDFFLLKFKMKLKIYA